MGAELGATSSIFPSDEVTRAFLAAAGREDVWRELAADAAVSADAAASYAKVIEIDLSGLEPLAACPHSPDNVQPVRELAGLPVDQVVIGSCTNSSLADLAAAAAIVEGKTVHPRVSAGLACGSRSVLLAAEEAGILAVLLRAGFRLLECACGPCIGMGFAPKSGGVSLRTFNRNFKGRSGTPDARVYLVSPQTAAASAIAGAVDNGQWTVDSRQGTGDRGQGTVGSRRKPSTNAERKVCSDITDKNLPTTHYPLPTTHYPLPTTIDNLLIPPLPPEEAAKVEIERGPNIKPCPVFQAPPDKLTLTVLIKTGDNISTDDIMPAGAKVLPLRSNIPEIAKHVFSAIDSGFYERAKVFCADAGAARPAGAANGGCIIGGNNYGQGSSREHAALAPAYLGVKAVIVRSFARIHKANLINYGILPFTFASPADYGKLEQGAALELSGIHSLLEQSGRSIFALNPKTGERYELVLEADGVERRVLRLGGRIAAMRSLPQGGKPA
jgi:aconitate hydratase